MEELGEKVWNCNVWLVRLKVFLELCSYFNRTLRVTRLAQHIASHAPKLESIKLDGKNPIDEMIKHHLFQHWREERQGEKIRLGEL